MLKTFFAAIMIIHGLIHLMGFVKGFQLAEINQLTQTIQKPIGLLWLVSALLFTSGTVTFLFKYNWWWIIVAFALVLSQLLIVMYWQDAKFGTIVNVIILAGIVFWVWKPVG